MKKIIKIIRVLIQAVLAVILIFTVFTFITSKTDKLGSIRSMVVLSASMYPSIPTGSVIYTRTQLGYNKNDVITFKNSSGKNVTHRISEIIYNEEGTSYLTKGDANNSPDADLVSFGKVSGKVFFSLPFIGVIIAGLNSPTGFISFILVPSVLFILIELSNIKREIEKQAEKRIIEKYGIQGEVTIQTQ